MEIPPCYECLQRKEKSVFCCLLPCDLNSLSEGKESLHVKKGQIIFREGDRGSGLHCIHKGKVKIHKMGDMARDQIVRFAKEGEILGYRSLLSDEPYNASATALEDSDICFIPRSTFLDMLSQNSRLAMKTIQVLAKDLKESEARMVNITQKPATERLSEALLSLEKTFGLARDNKTLDVVLKRSELGELSGMTTETTIRTLSELNKKGVINLVGKQIQLTDIRELRRLANEPE